MAEPRERHIFWPLLLITVGVVLLLEQFGLLHLEWTTLWRLWPVLLILAGIELILNYTHASGVVMALVALVVIGIALGIALLGPGLRPAELARQSLSYPAEGVERAKVELHVDVSRLEIVPLSEDANVLEAEITYAAERTELTHTFTRRGDEAQLLIQAKNRGNWGTSVEQNGLWRVALNPQVPLELTIHTGVGSASLDLRPLTLESLYLNAGVGKVNLTLPQRGRYSVRINGGVGALTVEVPAEMEARVRVDGGVGSVEAARRFRQQDKYYVTAGYDTATERAEVDIDGGVGSVTLR